MLATQLLIILVRSRASDMKRSMPTNSATPVTGFVGFQQYTNRVEGRGAVWNENILKAGFKVDLWNGVAAPPTVETTQPFPLAIRMNATF